MTEDSLACPDCTASYTVNDNYCRKCGMYVAALRAMPLVQAAPADPPMRLDNGRAGLPAPVKKAATALAIGTALQIGVNLAGRYLAGHATRAAANSLRSRPASMSKPAVQQSRELIDAAQDTVSVSETVMVRRVWIRRN